MPVEVEPVAGEAAHADVPHLDDRRHEVEGREPDACGPRERKRWKAAPAGRDRGAEESQMGRDRRRGHERHRQVRDDQQRGEHGRERQVLFPSAAKERVRCPERAHRPRDRPELRVRRAHHGIDDDVGGESEGDSACHGGEETEGSQQEQHEQGAKPPEQGWGGLVGSRQGETRMVQEFDEVVEADLVEVEQWLPRAVVNPFTPANG